MNLCCSPISSTSHSELFGEKRNRNRNAVMWPLLAGRLIRLHIDIYIYELRTHEVFGSVVWKKERNMRRRENSRAPDDDEEGKKNSKRNIQNQQRQQQILCM